MIKDRKAWNDIVDSEREDDNSDPSNRRNSYTNIADAIRTKDDINERGEMQIHACMGAVVEGVTMPLGHKAFEGIKPVLVQESGQVPIMGKIQKEGT